jgi:hypothetical protein
MGLGIDLGSVQLSALERALRKSPGLFALGKDPDTSGGEDENARPRRLADRGSPAVAFSGEEL